MAAMTRLTPAQAKALRLMQGGSEMGFVDSTDRKNRRYWLGGHAGSLDRRVAKALIGAGLVRFKERRGRCMEIFELTEAGRKYKAAGA